MNCVQRWRRGGKPNSATVAILCALSLQTASVTATSAPTESSASSSAATETEPRFFNFSVTSLSYLAGFNWNTPFAPSAQRDVLTLEHFHDNRVGDVYFFLDAANLLTEGRGFPGAGVDFYGEVSPRLSLFKLMGKPPRTGLVKDVLAYSGTLELGRSGSLDRLNDAFGLGLDTTHAAQLHGMGIDFNIPGFQVASLNAYWRDNLDVNGSTWQLTWVWATPFKLGSAGLVFKGFADWAGSEGRLASIFHTSPQLLLDLGSVFGGRKQRWWLGAEVDIWINEFGVDGQHDAVPQAVLQFTF